MGLHAGDLRHGRTDRALELSAISCASSSDSRPGSLTCSDSSVRPSTSISVRLCTSRTREHGERCGDVRALAKIRGVLDRLDVDDDVRLGQRPADRRLDRIRRGMALSHCRP